MANEETRHPLPDPVFDAAPGMLVVLSPYYKDIADNLLTGARSAITSCGGTCEVIEVPGALEIPTAIRLASRSSRFDGYVALGCVIRGETTHYDTVCNDSSRALALLGLEGLCIGNGILTVENRKQARVRADANGQNKGGGAALAALHLVALARKFSGNRSFRPDSEHILMAGDPGDMGNT